jgi:hypothetical protein
MNNMRQRDISKIASEIVSSVVTEHAGLAEMSNMAAVAGKRLQISPAPSAEDIRTVLGILRCIENIGLVSFLRRHGTEDDYQAIGASVARRYENSRLK